MISKRIQCKKVNDNYARLANYIADASHKGEKSLVSWCAGAWAGDDYALAIQEVVDTQVLNTRTTKEKTYHLMISFRPEDEATLTPELYKTIEERFAKALGFEEHQRHCGVHKNTGNLHMHIAYNMIHPERLTRKEPYRDFWVRDTLCRELEQEFTLTVDHGRGQKTENSVTLEEGAARMEAHTGHQSFEGYVQSHKADIMATIKNAGTWEEVHKAFADYGVELVPHGNGLVIRDRHTPKKKNHAMKASALDRSLSKKKLTDRFGAYVSPHASLISAEQKRYVTKPLQSRQSLPERDALYAEYAKGMEERKATLAGLNADFDRAQKAIKEKWDTKRQELIKATLGRAAQYRFLKLAKVREAEELLEARKNMNAKKESVATQIPYTSWNNFLQQKALQGSDVALDILRSRGQAFTAQDKTDMRTPRANTADTIKSKSAHLQKRKEILMGNFSQKTTTTLLNIVHMQELDATVKYAVDKKGTLIFTFADGKTIRDTGKGIYFSPQIEDRAKAYATKRWGKGAVLDKGVFVQQRPRERIRQSKGMER